MTAGGGPPGMLITPSFLILVLGQWVYSLCENSSRCSLTNMCIFLYVYYISTKSFFHKASVVYWKPLVAEGSRGRGEGILPCQPLQFVSFQGTGISFPKCSTPGTSGQKIPLPPVMWPDNHIWGQSGPSQPDCPCYQLLDCRTDLFRQGNFNKSL